MYRFAENTKFIRDARFICSTTMKELEHLLKSKYGISSQISLVGSAKRNLITFNGHDHSFDFDYNLLIYNGMDYSDDLFYLKNQVRLALNEIMRANHWPDVNNSTSSLTTNPLFLAGAQKGMNIHIDLAITTYAGGHIHRLIFDKPNGRMLWQQAGDLSSLKQKEKSLKETHWLEVRERYLVKKNQYINDKDNHPSYICYLEAVNEVFDKYFLISRTYGFSDVNSNSPLNCNISYKVLR